MLRRLLGEKIQIRTALSTSPGYVKADRGQLEQVVVNLAINARDAMAGGGQLTLTTANLDAAEPLAHSDVTVPPGAYVALAVRDTGCGIDPATRARIFEPFFTTKESGEGTGLGLATVYGIVRQSDGYIAVESEPGRGSTFTVYLPRAPAPLDTSAPAPPVPGAATGTETVLLVEDDGQVRSLARAALQAAGYSVLEASGGADALRISGEHPGTIDLLLTDVVMPGMSGQELADRLVAHRPHARVLYISGYAEPALAHQGQTNGPDIVLQKPFGPGALVRRVRQILDIAPRSS
jgi:CheY-like chemotaxis protein